MDESRSGLSIIAIVAVVAVVSLVMMNAKSGANSRYPAIMPDSQLVASSGSEDATGMAYALNCRSQLCMVHCQDPGWLGGASGNIFGSCTPSRGGCGCTASCPWLASTTFASGC